MYDVRTTEYCTVTAVPIRCRKESRCQIEGYNHVTNLASIVTSRRASQAMPARSAGYGHSLPGECGAKYETTQREACSIELKKSPSSIATFFFSMPLTRFSALCPHRSSATATRFGLNVLGRLSHPYLRTYKLHCSFDINVSLTASHEFSTTYHSRKTIGRSPLSAFVMGPKQATLGYVRDPQLTLRWVVT